MYQQKLGSFIRPVMMYKVKKILRILKRFTKNLFYNLVFRVIKLIYYFVKKKSTLTCYSGNDGGGAQLQRIMSVASLCHYLGIEFVFTPISEIDFHPIEIVESSWIKEWNSLINFSDVYTTNDNYQLKKSRLFDTIILTIFKKNNYAISGAHKFADSHPDEYDKLISSKGLNITKNNETNIPIKTCSKNIILHYRMPIVGVNHKLFNIEKRREVSISKFIYSVEKIKEQNNIEANCIRVFLYDKNMAPYDLLYRFPEVTFDDSTNAIDAIRLMSISDVLLVSYSSMSYLAALFNKNIVYHYRDFWHSPKSYWKGIW